MTNLYQEIHYPLSEASDCMVTVSVFQSGVKLHIRQFHRDYYGKLRAGKTGITISEEEFSRIYELDFTMTIFISKILQERGKGE